MHIFAVLLAACFSLLVRPILGCAFGSVVGWIAGVVFSGTMSAFLGWAGAPLEPWQLGCVLGFVSGFFSVTSGGSE